MLTLLFILSIAVTFGVYKLVQAYMMENSITRFFGILSICIVATLMNVGPLGLILGGPSILLSSILISLVFERKGVSKKTLPEISG